MHLSDLHFGRTDPSLLDPLTTIVHALRPHLIVVSGDLTQRARTAQFIEARAFLDRLPMPQLVVPGNHDVPLYDVLARFMRPLARYRRYITDDLEPRFIDEEIAVLGVNTARSLTFKQGRINEGQIARVRQRLCALPDRITKVVVTHHPFDLPSGYDSDDLVRRAALAREMLSACRCDLLLAGHLHLSVATEGSMRSDAHVYEPIVVQAGSATSTRSRGESNSFNVLLIESRHIEVRRYVWQPSTGGFDATESHHFQCMANGWKRVSP
ncbi:MAG: metallophosphoesterase [Betaproteobacteria bacterium]